jgi:hypothetical protein
MMKNSGNFLERHSEKIVLALVGIVCLWIGLTRVIVSPNKVVYERDKLAPGQIDSRISTQAKAVVQRLNSPPKPVDSVDPKYGAFSALVEGYIDGGKPYKELFSAVAKLYPAVASYAISDVNAVIILPNPSINLSPTVEDREYRLPRVVAVNEPSVGYLRAVAYQPVAVVDRRNEYSEKNSEPNDLDFVTVQAKFNVSRLYERFYEAFAGHDVPEDWRDPCLAVPVFSAVQLDRQQLLSDGSWSRWRVVPRARIDSRREMLNLADVGKLPLGGIKVRLLQFRGWETARDILQPPAYRIASAEEEWFPPSLRPKYLEAQRKEEARQRRELMDKKERERDQERARPGRDRGPYSARSLDRYESREAGSRTEERAYRTRPPAFGAPGRSKPRSSARRTPSKNEYNVAMNELADELDKLLIKEQADFATMSEPLVFWAHDDTVVPGKAYRYRIRLGVFNPTAGTNKISLQEEPRKDDVILWSQFSKATEPLDIPNRLYFFPLREAGTVGKVVTVQVSRYLLGYWYNWNFPVQQGEVIGTVVQNKQTDDEDAPTGKNVTLPESIDYSTGAVLVDVATVNGWSGFGGASLIPRYCSDVLYSYDGATIEHLPISYGNWPKELQIKFNEIKKLAEKVKKPWRSWTEKRDRRSRYPTRTDDGSSRRRDEEERDRRSDGEDEAYQRMMESIGSRRR